MIWDVTAKSDLTTSPICLWSPRLNCTGTRRTRSQTSFNSYYDQHRFSPWNDVKQIGIGHPFEQWHNELPASHFQGSTRTSTNVTLVIFLFQRYLPTERRIEATESKGPSASPPVSSIVRAWLAFRLTVEGSLDHKLSKCSGTAFVPVIKHRIGKAPSGCSISGTLKSIYVGFSSRWIRPRRPGFESGSPSTVTR
jgi:hypothetical protein